eukprot:SAG22_NODE_2176_length_2884_cov_1.337882_3_plen_117_part_00
MQSDGQCLYNPLLERCQPDWRHQDLAGIVPGMPDALVDFSAIASEVFAYLFTVELLTKLLALGVKQWWAVGWNRFDFLIVVTSLAEIVLLRLAADIAINPSIFRIFRICRVVRFVR